MKLPEKQRLILFVLGKLYDEANKKLNKSLLEVSVSKSAFIEIVKKAELAKKKKRALYKNLESLEKSKMVSYDGKILRMSDRGLKAYNEIDRQLAPYVGIIKTIEQENLIKLTSKARTTFIRG